MDRGEQHVWQLLRLAGRAALNREKWEAIRGWIEVGSEGALLSGKLPQARAGVAAHWACMFGPIV